MPDPCATPTLRVNAAARTKVYGGHRARDGDRNAFRARQSRGTFRGAMEPPDTLRSLLQYFEKYEEEAREEALTVFWVDGRPMLRKFAAATWLRVPYLLRGVLSLARDHLGLEVDVLLRVLLELAIVAMWVGNDEERAQAARDQTLARMREGHRRLAAFGVKLSDDAQLIAREWLKSFTDRTMPNLRDCADQVREAGLRKIAVRLYGGFYDNYSVASHAELRAAEKLARGVPSEVLEEAVTDAVEACASILMAVAEPLNRVREIEQLLEDVYRDKQARER
jgi:hypothetical protein